MSYRGVPFTGSAALALLLVGSLAAGEDRKGTAAVDRDDALFLEVRTAEEIVGRFAHGGSFVSFESRRDAADHVTLHVEVNALRIDFVMDLREQSWRTDGHHGMVMLEDKLALAALVKSWEKTMTPAGLDAEGRPEGRDHERVLYDSLSFWAEAPVGTVFAPRQNRAAQPLFAIDRQADVAFFGPPAEACGCNVNGENGITYFNCNVTSFLECHDNCRDSPGSVSHCMACVRRPAGRNSAGCAGRCGAGCSNDNPWGTKYTFDCLDHDWCCRIHGGCFETSGNQCGDEFWEADDDFRAGRNC